MRRYRVVISAPPASGGSNQLIYDSQINNQDNMSAQDISFDITTTVLNLAAVGSYLEIFGVSLETIAKVQQWQGGTLSLYGGFSTGFPLANAKQYGLIATGYILQAFGNWIGTHQSIAFFLVPAPTNQAVTLFFYWPAGTTLSSALQKVVSQQPGYTFKSALANDPVATTTDMHIGSSLYEIFQYVSDKTNDMGLAPQLGGIRCVAVGSIVTAYDTPSGAPSIPIAFNDFQGQPAFFGLGGDSIVQTTLNLRSDFSVGGTFSFPTQVATGFLLTQPQANAPLPKNNSLLNGNFFITSLRHVGSFRDPQGQSWVTIVNANPTSLQ